MKITLSGKAGSGKTTLAKRLAKKLDYKQYSIGDLRGKMDQERGLTIDELNKIGEKNPGQTKKLMQLQKK